MLVDDNCRSCIGILAVKIAALQNIGVKRAEVLRCHDSNYREIGFPVGGRLRVLDFYGLRPVCVDSMQRNCACQTRGLDPRKLSSTFQKLAEELPVPLIQNVDSRREKAARPKPSIHPLQLHYRAQCKPGSDQQNHGEGHLRGDKNGRGLSN